MGGIAGFQPRKQPRHRYLGFNPTVSPHFSVFEFFLEYDDDFLLGHGVQVYSSETGQWVHKGDNSISFFANYYYSRVFLNNGCVHYLTSDPAIAVVDTQGGSMPEHTCP